MTKPRQAPSHRRQAGRHDQGGRGGVEGPFAEVGAHPPEEVQEYQPQDRVRKLVQRLPALAELAHRPTVRGCAQRGQTDQGEQADDDVGALDQFAAEHRPVEAQDEQGIAEQVQGGVGQGPEAELAADQGEALPAGEFGERRQAQGEQQHPEPAQADVQQQVAPRLGAGGVAGDLPAPQQQGRQRRQEHSAAPYPPLALRRHQKCFRRSIPAYSSATSSA